MNRISLSAIVVALLATPTLAQLPTSDRYPLNADALHERVMRGLLPAELLLAARTASPTWGLDTSNALFGNNTTLSPEHSASVAYQWGCHTLPLPAYLRSDTLGLAMEQGLLITQVDNGSPSRTAGLCAGQLIVAIDGMPCDANQPLPPLNAQRCVTVLSDAGVSEITVRPLDSSPSWPPSGLRECSRLLPGLENLPPDAFADAGHSCQAVRSLAISQVGEETVICAWVETTASPVKIELRGNAQEIECQLRQLAPEIQQALRPILPF